MKPPTTRVELVKKCTLVRKKTRKPTQIPILLQYARDLLLVYEHRFRDICILVGSSTIMPEVYCTVQEIERYCSE